MRVQILPPAPYADVSIMVLPRIANPFIPFEGCAGSSPVVRATKKGTIMELKEEVERIKKELADLSCVLCFGKTIDEFVKELFDGEIV